RVGCARDVVARAEVTGLLDADEQPDLPSAGRWGDPVACEVRVMMRDGQQAVVRRVTVCGVHDPSRERRSARRTEPMRTDLAVPLSLVLGALGGGVALATNMLLRGPHEHAGWTTGAVSMTL